MGWFKRLFHDDRWERVEARIASFPSYSSQELIRLLESEGLSYVEGCAIFTIILKRLVNEKDKDVRRM